MKLVDTHSHIYLPEFGEDRQAMVERAVKEGVTKVLLPAIDSTTHGSMLELEESSAGWCSAMIGLHPCSVKEDPAGELEIVSGWLKKRRFIAIGEIGLDFYWDKSWISQQYAVFSQQIEWALEYDIPIVIHSREAVDECIEVVRKHQNGKLKGVFHCFSGSFDQANKIIELGFYLGIGGVITFKNAGLDKVMKGVSLEHVVLETDAPYLAPVPFRGKRNEPSYLKYVVEKLVEVKNMDGGEVANITTGNAEKLFGI